MGDYVNHTLGEDDAGRAEMHLSVCAECSCTVSELENTSTLVHALHRASTPVGFEERLKARLSAQEVCAPLGTWAAIRARLQSAGAAIWGIPGHRLVLRPALTALLLCVVIATSLMVHQPSQQTSKPDTDWAYINTCKDQHASFAGANPLGDESAAALRERAGESDTAL